MNMSSMPSMGNSNDMMNTVHDWRWAQEMWPNCRNLTIYGPNSPQSPPSAIQIAAMTGKDSWYGMEKYAKGVTWICLGLIGLTIIPGLVHRWRRNYPIQANKFLTSTVIGRVYLSGLTLFRAVGYRTPSFSWGKKGWGRYYLPQMNHLIVIASVWVAVTIWIFTVRPYYRCLREWGSPPLSLRAGMMANGLFPFLFALGSKYNIITIVSNISYERLQVYHQWLARLVLFLGFVHAIPFIVQPVQEGGTALMHEYYFNPDDYQMYYTGTASMALLVWMIISSTSVLRNLSYEFFVLQHVASIIMFLAFYFIHTGNELNSWLWLWATIGLWGIAILVRMVRGAMASDFFVGKRALVETNLDTIELDTALLDQDPMIRITIRTNVKWLPGQHIMLHFPSLGFMQPHPFTVTTLPDPDRPDFDSTAVFMARARSGLTRLLFNLNVKAQLSDKLIENKNNYTSPTEMGHQVILRKQHGIASNNDSADVESEVQDESEKNSVTACPNLKKQGTIIPASVDGPYGTNASAASYDGVILIAGGSGFSVIISILQDLAIKAVRQRSSIATRQVHIFWSVRTSSSVQWMREQLDNAIEILSNAGIDTQIQIAITRSGATVGLPSYARINASRASVETICKDAIDEMSSNYVKSVCCTVCGPMKMAMQTQNAIRQSQRAILRGRSGSVAEVYLNKCTFSW
ncbi:uncharacterized protein FA14DRAFT_160038 [Meira miltonrushii]|uniref:ferric-chelate reductase (NADPH) n=1 Tax=Meira miltonrushii TaxID=1280837 RepID=A0A316VSQ9_9BASI|nr:uncharacterized protein FA14DRAFT_160038 [Meira miltonrushii]PWN38545.1 hypothetical protein FA14DRAFT_160038 [Meira miltonrushii]